MSEIKKCPFCGGDSELIQDVKTKVNHGSHRNETTSTFWVKCSVCQVSSWAFSSFIDASNHWNRRVQ